MGFKKYKDFKDKNKELNEGGNTTVQTRGGVETKADTIPLKDIGRRTFVNRFTEVLIAINNQYKADHGEKLWADEKLITKGTIFNGSTSYIMSPDYSDEEIVQHKQIAGDLDVMVPRESGANLYETMERLENKEIVPGATYMGTNAKTKTKLGNTMICIVLMEFTVNKGAIRIPAQIDFELSDFINDVPTDWASFSHSSSFDDVKAGVKGVHHKYLLRALIGAKSQRDDIVLVTPASTLEKMNFKKKQPNLVRLLQFGVDSGIGQGYAQMVDAKGKPIKLKGKFVYREKKKEEREKSYNKSLDNLYVIAFGEENKSTKKQMESLYSFVGILDLGKKKLDKKEQQLTLDRYFDILFSVTGGQVQPIDTDNPQNDVIMKSAAYNKIMNAWGLKRHKNFDEVVSNYVKRAFK